MYTTNMWTDTAFADSDKVMQFRVGNSVTDETNNEQLPQRFEIDIKFPSDKVTAARNFTMVSHMDVMWGIDSYHMDDPMKRILMRPPLGTIEKYTFKSSGMGMSMGSAGVDGMMMNGMMMGGKSNGMPGINMGGNSGGHHSGMAANGMSGSAIDGKSNDHKAMPTTANNIGNSGFSGHGHHGSGMGSMAGMMRAIKRSLWLQNVDVDPETKLEKRQSMMGGSGSGMRMGSMSWTHAIHLHLVVSAAQEFSVNAVSDPF
jgi:hypothetical protein